MKGHSTLVPIVLLAAAVATSSAAGELVVIVHATREVELSSGEVSQIYLKQRRFWSNGESIIALNRNSDSNARRIFDRAIFGRNTKRLAVYWNRRYFDGVFPPSTLASDEAMKHFVANERLAVGYIHPDLVDASVRVVLRLNAQ